MENQDIPEMENRLRIVRILSMNLILNVLGNCAARQFYVNFDLFYFAELRALPLVDGPNYLHSIRNQAKQHVFSMVSEDAVRF